MTRSPTLPLLFACACLALLVAPASANTTIYGANMEVQPGFPHDQTFVPGQLLYRQVGLGRITNIIYHNGWIYTNNFGDQRRTWRFTDPTNPASLQIVNTTGSMWTDHGTHGHRKVGRWAGGVFMNILAVAPGQNIHSGSEMPFNYVHTTPTPGGGSHNLYYPWKLPFNWVQYGGGSGRGHIWRANEHLADFNSLADHGVAGTALLVGDLLLMASDGSSQGVLAYDIGPIFDGQPPRLLDGLIGPIGGYLAGIWEHYIILSGPDLNRNLMHVVDFQDPTNLRLVTTINLAGTPALNAGTNVPYVQTQDQYVFTRRHKIDMEILIAAQDPESGYTEADAIVLEFDEVGNNRPPGSVPGRLDISQFTLPIGNLMLTGSYSFSGRDGMGVWAHQAEPDTRPPYVGYHRPVDGQTNFPLGAPISLVIAETLESFTVANGDTVIVRPIGGEAIDCWTSVSYDGIVTITPRQYLQPDTTYEVILEGIKDVVGNAMERYSFVFSTGSEVTGIIGPPVVHSIQPDPAVVEPGEAITLTVDASDPESHPLEYRFDFGDGSPQTEWSPSPTATHTFDAEGRFTVRVEVRNLPDEGVSMTTLGFHTQTVALPPPPGPGPTHSAPLALDSERRKLWVVNRDNDSVTRVDADTREVDFEVLLNPLLGFAGRIEPRSVAVVPSTGHVWISCSAADLVVVLDANGQLLESIATGYGSAPQGVALAPDGGAAFVSLYAGGSSERRNGQLLRFATATRTETGRTELGPTARPIAVTADGDRVYVGRFLSGKHFGEIWEVDAVSMDLTRTLELWRDRGREEGVEQSGDDGPGIPNYVSSLALSPHGDWLWYSAIKMDDTRGLFFQQETEFNTPLRHDQSTRSLLGRFDLTAPGGPVEPGRHLYGTARARIDIDNSDSPSALVFSPRGDYVFVPLQGNNTVRTFDDLVLRSGEGGRSSVWNLPVGNAPQGLLIDPVTETLWVQNFMSRDLTAHPVGAFLATGSLGLDPETIITSTHEKLSPEVLDGKQIFYFAGDNAEGINAMSLEGYISCATCHIDGSHDGRTWDFTQRGEGLRNTIDLRGRGGIAHGNVHWSGNFDEIQDFILDIVNEFGGTGFLPEGQTPHHPLGAPNAGRSEELDNLAAYVISLDESFLPRSPYRTSDGAMTAEALFGAQIFQQLNCISCHNPNTDHTDSTLGPATLHNVGTLRTGSGHRLGETLEGLATPTLLGIWDTPPYFHDGSAPTIDDVFVVAGGRTYEAEALPGVLVPPQPDIIGGGGAQGSFAVGNLTFTGVDGGEGGTGAVEVRFIAQNAGTMRIVVNGGHEQTFDYPSQQTHYEWRRARFENIPLAAGEANTIAVTRTSGSGLYGVDNITVSTAGDLALAAAHRVALDLDASDYDALIAYLLQLDGRDPEGDLPFFLTKALPPASIFQPWQALIEVAEGAGTIDWSVISGELPPGLSLDVDADGRTSRLSGTPLTGGFFTFEVMADDGQAVPPTRSFTLHVHSRAVAEGFIVREVWLGIPGTSVADLTNHPNFPDNPQISQEITSLEGPVNWIDNYGTRIHGFIIPEVSGSYTFWIASDDNSELWLSPDASPDNATRIAHVPGWTNSRQWTKYPEQRSQPVQLEAGRRYYINILHKEGTGGDNIAVGWLKPGESGDAPSEIVPGAVLSPYSEEHVDPVPPLAPTGLTATVVTHDQVDLAWTSPGGGVSGYLLERLTGSGSFTTLATLPGSATSYADADVSPQTHYTYRVRAFNAHGHSPWSNQASATTPAEPVIVDAVLLGDNPTISWSYGAFGPNNLASGAAYNGWMPRDEWTGGFLRDEGSIGSTATATFTDAPWGSGDAVRVFRRQNAFESTNWNFETQVPEAESARLGSLTQWDDEGVIPGAILWYRIDTGTIADPRPGMGSFTRSVPASIEIQLRFFDGGGGGQGAGNRTVASAVIPGATLVANGQWQQLELDFDLIPAAARAALSHDGASNPDAVTVVGVNILTPSANTATDTTFARLIIPVETVPEGPPAGSFAAWALAHFETTEQADPDIGGPHADPTRQGLSNLERHAFGLSATEAPHQARPVSSITEENGQQYLTFSYLRDTSTTDIEINVRASTDLDDWNAFSGEIQPWGDPEPTDRPDVVRETVRLPLPSDGSPVFLRLEITLTESP
ncbi:MAG: PKD domain-containing protein [Puniceicoccaceae bacterium]|nr:MAG: PKD domain-containing protein [Puniceicoccaceae bacterium]